MKLTLLTLSLLLTACVSIPLSSPKGPYTVISECSQFNPFIQVAIREFEQKHGKTYKKYPEFYLHNDLTWKCGGQFAGCILYGENKVYINCNHTFGNQIVATVKHELEHFRDYQEDGFADEVAGIDGGYGF